MARRRARSATGQRSNEEQLFFSFYFFFLIFPNFFLDIEKQHNKKQNKNTSTRCSLSLTLYSQRPCVRPARSLGCARGGSEDLWRRRNQRRRPANRALAGD